MKLYLLDANEQIIDAPPTKDVLSLIQDLKLKDTDTIEGALVVSKRYTSIMDNVRYIAVSDRDNDHAFYLYRKTMAEVQDRELIFDGKESFWDDLAGSYIKDKRPGAMLAPDLVKLILDGTRWNVDFVDSGFTETLDTNFYYQSRSDALSSIMSAMTIDVVPMINIEDNTITRRYVNLYLQAGGDNGRRFVYGKNALSVVKKTDDSQVFTALVGRGKSIEQTSTDTETGDTSTYNTPKINFADIAWSKAAGDPVDKPKGQEYVEWPESTKLYGYSNGNPRIGIVDFDNDDDPAQLLKDTWAQLQTTGVPSVQFSATVGDVGYLNKGETVTIVNYVKGIAYKTRVTELKWNRLAEAKSQLTIGDKLVQNANERMTSIATQQSSTAIQAATQTIAKQVANLVTVTNSLGVNVSWSKDGALPLEPKEGDIVYIRNDDGTITMKSYKDGQWVIIIDDTTGQQIQKKVDAKMVQLNADMSAADANLQAAKQDIDDLQVKLKANDDRQAQLKIDLSDNAELINQVKTDTANSLEKVNNDLTQAQTDTAAAVKNADLAVTNAQSAVEASGLATNTANAANDAATAAKELATSTANSFVTVQAQSATAANDAAIALDQAKSAIGNAADALNKVNGISVGGTNLIVQSSLKYGYIGTDGSVNSSSIDFYSENYIATNGATVFTFSSPDYAFKGSSNLYDRLAMYDSDKNYLGYQPITSATQIVTQPNAAYIRFSINSADEGNTTGSASDWLANHRYKLEKGNLATDWSPSPEDVQIQIDKVNGELSQKVSQTTYNTLAGTVDKVSTLAKQNQSTITTLATSASVDAVSGRVTKAQTLAEQTADGLTFKADSSTVDTLSNTVEQQGIDLKAAQGELKLKLTQSDLTKGLDGYATQTWAQNQITASATELSSTMTTVQTQVQDSAVGTNLAIGTSKQVVQANSWNMQVADIKYDKSLGGNLCASVMINNADHASDLLRGNAKLILKTFDSSGNILKSIGGNDISYNANGISQCSISINDGTSGIKAYIWTNNMNQNAFYSCLKIEKGSVATDWCPNPADNASVTALSSLSQTVDGLTGTFATKNDLATTTTKLDATANGLSVITAVTGTNGENVTQVIADVNNIKTTMTGANGYTTRLQTLEGFQTTATDNITNLQTQQTTLAGQYTSLIESADNKVLTPWFDDDQTGTWNNPSTQIVGGPDSDVKALTGHSKYLKVFSRDNYEGGVGWFSVTPGEVYYFSGYMGSWGTTYAVGVGLNFVTEDGSLSWVTATGFPANSKTPISAIAGSITVPAGVFRAQTWVQIDGPVGTDLGFAAIDGLRISKSASNSQITQLQGLIDARVTVDNKVTAALSLSADGGGTVTIRGASLYVTAASHFDNASIQSAAIANLDASKITSGSISADRLTTTKLNADNITSGSIAADLIATTALSATNIISGTLDVGKLTVKNLSADLIASGTIDASKITVKNLSASNIIGGELDAGLVNVKNLNASNIISGELNAGLVNVVGLNASAITTGTISGANLAINLNTGEVLFTKGSIKSIDGHLNIDVNNGTFAQSDGNKGMMFANGNLYLSSSSWWDEVSGVPYTKPDYGFIGYTDTLLTARGFGVIGRDALTLGLTDNGNTGMEYTASPVITMGRSNVTLNFAGELATIQAGQGFTINTSSIYNLAKTPGIQIGSNVDRSGIGDRVFIDGSYVYIPSAYSRTSSGSANLIVAADGAIVRTSSATKYKSNIERFRNTDMGETLLTLPQAHWYNKQDMQRYTDDPQHYSMPELDYGMIAEDLAAAGLEDLVVRGDDGQLEDIRYDRMAPALLPLLAKMKQEIEELKSAEKST